MGAKVTVGPAVRRLGSPYLVRESDVDTALTTVAAGSVGPAGLVITGGPGMGKSAVARRVLERLHADGWAVTAVVGRWHPVDLFAGVAEAMDTCGGDFWERERTFETLGGRASDDTKFETVRQLLERVPLALLFDDLGQNLGDEGYLDPGFGEAFDRLCRAVDRGRVLVTSRELPPSSVGVDRLGVLRLDRLEVAAGVELAAGLPGLSAVDPAVRERVVVTVAAHPRSLQFVDAWLTAGGTDPGERLAAVTPGTTPVGLALAELTTQQREALLQVAIATFPVTARDLAVACDASNPSLEQRQNPDPAAVEVASAGAARLTEVGLLNEWVRPDADTVYFADRWIAEMLAPHQGEALAARHERAINMHYARTRGDSGSFDDYVAVSRHLVAVQGMGDLTSFTLDVTKSVDRDYAGMALLGEIAPSVPAGNGHYLLIRERQTTMLIRRGYLRAALEVADRTLRAVTRWAATHPQRDEARFCLGAAHNGYGLALFYGGDMAAAEAVFDATVDVYHELAAEHPTSVEAQRRLGYALEHLGDVYHALNRTEYDDKLYKTWAECAFVRTQLFEADPSPDTALMAGPTFQRLADLAEKSGDRDTALTFVRSRLTMAESIAMIYPDDEELAEELATARAKLAALGADD